MKVNLFYASLIPIGLILFVFFALQGRETVAFYGFAETNEVEINYNHPVVVNNIRVTPGQYVTKGTKLLNLSRISAKEELLDQDYRISELLAEEDIWQQNKQNELSILRAEQRMKLERLDAQLADLQQELAYRESLTEGLSTLSSDTADYQPLRNKIALTQKERTAVDENYELRIGALKNRKRVGKSPYHEQIARLRAELQFERRPSHSTDCGNGS